MTETDRPSRIGLFGGTFDPVHYGHLRPAVEIAEIYSLDTLYLLPNHRPAHRGPTSASTAMRIFMLETAIRNTERLVVDAREALRDRPTYTIDTLREVHAEQPMATLVFFMGLDAFAEFDTWRNWDAILEIANLVIINRPGAEHSEFSRNLVKRQQQNHGVTIQTGSAGIIEQCDVTQLAISATDVRRRIAAQLSVRFLLPDDVWEYIVKNGLYSE